MNVNLVGKKFNQLLVLKRNGSKIYGDNKKSHHALWLCRCDCGKEINIITSKLRGGYTKSCGCHKAKNLNHRKGKNNSSWKGYEDISGGYFCSLKNSAKIRDINFNISITDIWSVFIKQDKKCALSGEELKFSGSSRNRSKEQTASIDRIDSLKGYTIDNIQIIHKDINYMKYKLKQDIFLFWVEKIFKHNFN